ncbi:hypothetical protein QC822_09755 [Halomonas salina]|nr:MULTISPECIES: hypothetical protein [Halomonas]MDR5889830.1 hypothetical protein [Halomonas salina]
MQERMLNNSAVSEALRLLWEMRTHQALMGYFAILHSSRGEESDKGVSVNFKAFYDRFCKVKGGPHPYIKIFTQDSLKWQNKNVAGSYSPSSVRAVSPLRKVVDIVGEGRQAKYVLKEQHYSQACAHLAFNNKIPIELFSAVLFRDHLIHAEEGKEPEEVLRDAFLSEFIGSENGGEYLDLFASGFSISSDVSWFE